MGIGKVMMQFALFAISSSIIAQNHDSLYVELIGGQPAIADTAYANDAARTLSTNVYKDDGTLTENRTLGLGGFDLDMDLLYLDASSGNVGIGTTTPSAKLDIDGSVRFQDYGSNSITGTVATLVAFEATGDVIETRHVAWDVSNNMFGSQAGISITSGYNNIFTGTQAGIYTTTGHSNIFQGYRAGFYNAAGTGNFFAGHLSGFANTSGSNNVAIGGQAGYSNLTASNNVFLGNQSGYSNTTGASNMAFGYRALFLGSTGSNNSAVGSQALYSTSTGTANVGIGLSAGYFYTTGSNNVAIGSNSGVSSGSGDLVNTVALGASVKATANDQIRIGLSSQTTVFDGNVGIGTTTPGSKLTVTSGDIYIETISKGVILKSPDGTCWRWTPANTTGVVTATSITCP